LATLEDMDEGKTLEGSKDPDSDYVKYILPKKRELELYYVQNKSLWLNLKIIFLTTYRLLKR